MLSQSSIERILAAALSRLFGAEMRWFSALFSGLLEVSHGVGAMRGMPPTAVAITGFPNA